jgi:hypothetical protein
MIDRETSETSALTTKNYPLFESEHHQKHQYLKNMN